MNASSHGRRALLALPVLTALLLGLGACDGDDDESSSTPAPTAAIAEDDTAVDDTASSGTSATADESTAPEAGGEPHSVSIVSDLSGPIAPAVVPAANGAMAYFDTINAEGGIDGSLIEYEVHDSQSTPEGATAQIRQAISDEPVAVLSFLGSGSTAQTADLMIDSGLAYFPISGADTLYLPEPLPNFWTLNIPTAFIGQGMVAKAEQLLDGSLDGKQIAIIGVNAASVDALLETLHVEIEAGGGEIVAEERYDAGTPAFDVQAANAAREEPDLIMLMPVGAEVVTVIDALGTAGFEGPMINWVGGSSRANIEAVASENYHAMRGATLGIDSDVLSQAGATTGHTDGIDNPYWAAGWSAAHVVAEALRGCGGGCTSDQMVEFLNSETHTFEVPGDALYGPVEISAADHVGPTAVGFVTWDPASSAEVASGDPIAIG